MSAKFNPFNSAVNTGMFDTVAPGGAAVETLNLNAAEQALSPALGWLVVVHENKSDEEAVTVGLK
jgi:anthranilate phosphoribosyltransferase